MPTMTEEQTVQTLDIRKEELIDAPIEIVFQAMLDELGPETQMMDGKPMPMKLEAWPGGRWYRDLGNDNGHLWGHVQAIKRPVLLEITGPLFMSHPVVSNVQYRLTPVEGGTLIAFRHAALGFVPDDVRAGTSRGWKALFDRVRQQAERTQIRH